MKIISGNSNFDLGNLVAQNLKTTLTDVSIRRFQDMEIFVEIKESIRGQDVFLIQSTSFPANDHLMELLITIDALKRGSAKRITAVIPYFGYARQDRKSGPRTPISAKLVANLITAAGADRVLSFDLHSGQIQGFFDIPVDNLAVAPIFEKDLRKKFDLKNLIIVSPDVGGVVRAREMAKRLDVDLAIVDKRRPAPGISEVMNIIGDVHQKDCVLIDDIVDSAGTLCNAANALTNQGARSVCAYVVHGVLSGQAFERIQESSLKSLTISDSIKATPTMQSHKKVYQLSTAELLAEAISRIAQEKSVSSLFQL